MSATILAVVALVFITLDLAGGGLANAHGGARGALGSLYRGTDGALGPVRRFVQELPSVGSDRAKINALTRQNDQLRAQLAADTTDAATAKRLAALQLAANTVKAPIAAARVIGYGPGQGFEWTATIDVGRGSGIAVDQTVTDGSGLVGRVLHVDASTSVVLLAADPGSGVGVRDERTGELGVATGSGTKGFTVSPLTPGADLRVGDELQTGPAGQSTYAAGIPLGTITAVRSAGDGTTSATVRPATSPTALDVVGVIVTASPATAPRAALTPVGGR